MDAEPLVLPKVFSFIMIPKYIPFFFILLLLQLHSEDF